jgi:O-antigen/teichoic acid export membrane protein
VNGLVLLATGVQAALVTTPMTAHGARLEAGERRRFVAAVFWLQALLAMTFSSLLGLLVWLRGGVDDPALLGVGSALAVMGTWTREFQRSVQFLERNPGKVLRGDLFYALLAVAGLAAVWRSGAGVRAAGVLLIVGMAALLPGLDVFRLGAERLRMAEARRVLRLMVHEGKWTLPGMGVTWGQNTGYTYVVALLAGSAAVAEVAAARLFIMPIALLVTAWGRTFMPRAGSLYASGGAEQVLALCRRSTRALTLASTLYAAALCAFFVVGGGRLLGHKYAGLGVLVATWAAFLIANTVRSVASVTLLAQAAFRTMFGFSVVAAAVSIGLTFALVALVGEDGAVVGLLGGELMLAWLSWSTLLGRRGGEHVPPLQVANG